MRIVLAFDKFKGSATAQQLNDAARQALAGLEGLDVVCVPVADGGDGTVAVLAASSEGQWVTISVPGPLMSMSPVDAGYYIDEDGTALIEVAAASGLALVPPELRDPFRLSTFGTGLMMRDAMERGCRQLVLGLGGSATCDAGMGIMCALGAEFVNAEGRMLFPCGATLSDICSIESHGIPHEVLESRFTLLADVDNPLCGVRGTANVFAPQKGADPNQVSVLERGMCHVAAIVGDDIAHREGCGAAGGVPALMMHLLQCELRPGAPYVLERNGFVEALQSADLVITGEGRLDRQTLMGKGPGRVIGMARERGIPVAAVCGSIDDDLSPTGAGLLDAVAVSDGMTLDQAMDREGTLERVAAAVERLVSGFAVA